MKPLGVPRLLALVLVVVLSACGGGDRSSRAPRVHGKLPELLSAAFREEATGDPGKAVDLYLTALEAAAGAPDDRASVDVAMASVDALVHRSVNAFSDLAQTSSLADRAPEAQAAGGLDKRLSRIQEHAGGPFVPHLVAQARLALAERRGDAKNAALHRAASGCAREALVAGPLSYTPVSAVLEKTSLGSQSIPAQIAGPGPFTRAIRPEKVTANGCFLPLYTDSSAAGVREVVIDVDVPVDGVIGLGMRSSAAAALRAGGALVLERPYALGTGQVRRFARAFAVKGTLRLVARVAMESDFTSVEIGAWDAEGKPLRLHAPAIGAAAPNTPKRIERVTHLEARTHDERLAVALAALAAREPRTAEAVLHDVAARDGAPAELALAYGRAILLVRDLPNVKAQERARSAFGRVLEVWPSSWEGILEHAVLAGARRGRAEAYIEAIADLEATRGKANPKTAPLLAAFEAAVAGREGLHDRAAAAFAHARTPLQNTPLLRHVERAAFERTGKEASAFDCDARAPSDRTSLACYHALAATGERAIAERELDRLRALAESPRLYLGLSTRQAIEEGDLARAGRILEATPRGDRSLSNLYAVKGKGGLPEILSLAVVARDAPSALAGILRDAGDNPIATFDGVAERAVRDEPQSPSLAGAATAVLAHEERYQVEASGLVHFVLFDLRRVMGTTDVETNAQAEAPSLFGRDAMRVLRRRIFKKDGRILLPDPTPHAAQAHADLSQLEAGDAVEAIYEGWSVPGEMGNVGIDTPDLLPERTAVREANIEIRLPAELPTTFWSHNLLGPPNKKTEGGQQILTWRIKDKPVRRIETGVPKMDRNVMVSVSTTTWADVAKGVGETIASLDAESPEVTAWAHEAAGKRPPSKELVEALVAASGQAVKEASGVMLADLDFGRASEGQTTTARSILATHEGSRTWLVARALRELGVPTDIVVAENEPFSDSASFPPHFGRFMHPLAVAHAGGKEIWIDADVPGPPLPAGRVSPELRGRMALYPNGRIAPLPAVTSEGERDEIDVRLAIDDQGNATGSLTVLLRGRAAQDLAEALVRIVGLERQRALRGIALAWVPFATVEKVELSSTEGSWQVAIRAELNAPAYAQIEGTKGATKSWVLPGIDPIHYVFPRPYASTLGSVYASHGARENALAINRATQYHLRRRVELPAKAKIARLPGPFEGKGPLLAARRQVSVRGQTIEEDFVLEVTTGTVPRDAYEAFVGAARGADDAFRASTRVTPP